MNWAFTVCLKGNLHLVDPKLLEMAIRNIVDQNTCGTSDDALETRQVKCNVPFCTVHI
jgi:hypothetical protein